MPCTLKGPQRCYLMAQHVQVCVTVAGMHVQANGGTHLNRLWGLRLHTLRLIGGTDWWLEVGARRPTCLLLSSAQSLSGKRAALHAATRRVATLLANPSAGLVRSSERSSSLVMQSEMHVACTASTR